MNLYTYCHNDPINFIDPSGHYEVSDRNLTTEAQEEIKRLTDEYCSSNDPEEQKLIHEKAEAIRNNPDNQSKTDNGDSFSDAFDDTVSSSEKGYLSKEQWESISKSHHRRTEGKGQYVHSDNGYTVEEIAGSIKEEAKMYSDYKVGSKEYVDEVFKGKRGEYNTTKEESYEVLIDNFGEEVAQQLINDRNYKGIDEAYQAYKNSTNGNADGDSNAGGDGDTTPSTTGSSGQDEPGGTSEDEGKVEIETFINHVTTVESLAEKYYDEYLSSLSILMGSTYDKEYVIRKFTLDYLRVKGGYNTMQWSIICDGNNYSFVNYVDKNIGDEGRQYFSSDGIKSIRSMNYNEYVLDVPHMMATIQGEVYSSALKDWSGWAADLASLMLNIKEEGTGNYKNDAKTFLGNEAYDFGQIDMDSDIDGRLIANMLIDNPSMRVSSALSSYYLNTPSSNRYGDFIDYYGGSSGFSSAIDDAVSRPLIIIKGGNASEDISEAVKQEFYDYIQGKAGY